MGRQSMKSPPAQPQPTRYEDDVYTWIGEQIALLKAGKLDEIDAANVAEELSDVGNELRDKLESSIAVLTMHFLKWDYQAERRSRSWALSVAEQRRRILRLLKRNPGLKSVLHEAIVEGYADGRGRALLEAELPASALPLDCPYSFDDLITRAITFDDVSA